MDDIDITDSAFSLGIADTNDVITTGGGLNDYTMFIYIGSAILIAIIGMFVYKFYINKKANDNQQLDCEGGFCTMGDKPSPASHI
jgi:hypothetical protein